MGDHDFKMGFNGSSLQNSWREPCASFSFTINTHIGFLEFTQVNISEPNINDPFTTRTSIYLNF